MNRSFFCAAVRQAGSSRKEIAMNPPVSSLSGQEPLEIERKFLIEYPDPAWLEQQPGSHRVEIVQTYLLSDGSSTRRLRSWTEAG